MTNIVRFALVTAGILTWIALPFVEAVARKLGPESFVYRATGPGDNLWNIAREVSPGDGVSRNQLMFAILRKNPDAFRGGNINLLRGGVELAMPTVAEARAEVVEQVDRLASEHKSNWSAGQAFAPPLYELGPVAASEVGVKVAASPAPEAAISRATSLLPEAPSPAPPAPLPPIEQMSAWAAVSATEPSKPNAPDGTRTGAGAMPHGYGASAATGIWWNGSPVAVTLTWLVLGSLGFGALYELVRRSRSAGGGVGRRGSKGQASSAPVEPADLSRVLPKIEPVLELVTRSGAVGFAGRSPDEQEIDVKLRLAKAYVDVNRLHHAHQLLHEIRLEGAPHYRRFAEHLLASPS